MKLGAVTLLLLLLPSLHAASAQSTVGIAPVYDASGDAWGATYAQNLTLYTFHELRKSGESAILLNPGGVYSPGDISWLLDYAHAFADVGPLLAVTLQPSLQPGHGKWGLLADISLLDGKTGELLAHFESRQEIERRDTDLLSSYDDPWAGFKLGLTTGHRTFDKSPLGKAAQRMATDIADRLGHSVPQSSRASADAPSSGNTCSMHVRILYGYRHAASQAYSLMVNGLDQSTYLESGTSSFKASEGPLLVQFSIADAPYKMTRQSLYQTSPYLKCNHPTYIVDLGKSGEAFEHWE